ncbi:MAG: HAD family hydrolase [Erysipelotrichaceae bacterium]|nr:HAD family hydrolase [Erysipelotrichaceae bacterium]MDY5251512.1 HAD-IIB family hydrolase [Erysipelotrichaceae bacterium]
MLFAMDLDGTLISAQNGLDDETLQVLKKVLAQGHEIAFVTGRNYEELIAEEKLWELDAYIIGMNGTVILAKDRTVLLEDRIADEVIAYLYQEYPDVPLEYLAFDQKMLTVDKTTFVDHFTSLFPAGFLDDPQMKKIMEHFVKTNTYDCDLEMLKRKAILKVEAMINNKRFGEMLVQDLQRKFADNLTCLYEGNSLLICPYITNKGIALHWLCQYLALDKKEVFVFGDGENDIPMLQAFDNSYVVMDAGIAIKAYAKEVIDNSYDHGVIKKIMHIING